MTWNRITAAVEIMHRSSPDLRQSPELCNSCGFCCSWADTAAAWQILGGETEHANQPANQRAMKELAVGRTRRPGLGTDATEIFQRIRMAHPSGKPAAAGLCGGPPYVLRARSGHTDLQACKSLSQMINDFRKLFAVLFLILFLVLVTRHTTYKDFAILVLCWLQVALLSLDTCSILNL